jgi:phospholipid/cholesterol/gamma-HCH transport system substrate-binding protein
MENRAHALAAGMFALALGLAVVAAFWWLSGRRETAAEYIVESTRNVSGLNLQAQVRYRGMRAGRVQDIDLDPADPRRILIRIRIAEDIPVTRSTYARLGTQGVTGLAYVELDDSGESRERAMAGAGELPRIPMNGGGESLTETAQAVLARATLLLDRANSLLDRDNLGRVAKTLDNLEAASADLGRGMAQLPEVLAALRSAASEDNLRRLQSILANVERASGEAAPLAADLRATVASLQSLARRLDRLSADAGGELVGATLPRTHQVLEDVAGSARRLNRLLDELERSPQSLVFGRRPPRPGPGEAGFEAPK